MAVSVEDFANDLRIITPGEAVPAGQVAVLTRLLGAAEAIVAERSSGAPDSLKDSATLMIAGYLYDAPSAGSGGRFANAWRSSGASDILGAYLRRRALVLKGGTDSTASQATRGEPGETVIDVSGPPPGVRFFIFPFVANVVTFATLPGLNAQEIFDLGAGGNEIVADSLRAISVAAPVYCWQQKFAVFRTDGALHWAMVAIAHGDEAPSHFRLQSTLAPSDWDGRWRQATGQADAIGEAARLDVFWWPQVVRAFPETTVFEWPRS